MNFQVKLLAVFALLMGAMVALLIYFHYQSEKLLIKQSVGNLRNMVDIVHFSTQALSTEKHIDKPELDAFFREIKRKSGIFEVSVVDFTDKVIASTDAGKVGSKWDLNQDSLIVRMQTEVSDTSQDKVRYEVRIPLVRDKQVEGIVEISLFLNDLRSYLWRLSLRQAIIFMSVLACAFGLFFLILQQLHRPFRQLAMASKKVAGGDFNVHLEETKGGEEREMASAFNQMARKLLEQRLLEDRLNALERRAILTELGASLAHEIRNPLNLMNLTIHHLDKNLLPNSEEHKDIYHSHLNTLRTEVQHINQVVTDFLSVGKPFRLKIEKFRLSDLLGEISVRLKFKISEKKIHLIVDCPEGLTANGDREQLRLVFLNLLINCIDIAPMDSCIEVGVKKSSKAGEIVCAVCDQGPGINSNELELIFDPYFSKREGGIGLGLTLSRRIVEEHGGKISASNRDSGGARFEFTLSEGA